MSKLLVLELSEVSLEVIQSYAKKYPDSAFARYLGTNQYCRTFAEDLPEELLYPTQTWASINQGKPFSEHGIKWFNDPKNYQDFYWADAAAKGCSTVLVSTLHSSPLNKFLKTGNYKAVIPDFFASDSETFPKKYEPLQALNRELTFSNRRTTSTKDTLLTATKHFIKAPNLARWGIGLKSLRDMIPLTLDVAKNPESLRKFQFPIMMQLFLNEITKHKPELGVVGTNHLASAMHRYLHATPEVNEGVSDVYDDKWMKKHGNDVMDAMHLADRWVDTIDKFATKNNYSLALVSSMSQKPNKAITADYINNYSYDYKLKDANVFFNRLGVDINDLKQVGAMLPQYAYQAKSMDEAIQFENTLNRYSSDKSVDRYGHYTQPNETFNDSIQLSGILLSVDRNEDIVTVSIMLKPDNNGAIQIGEDIYDYSELGFERFAVYDHHSGTHSKWGVLLFNQRFKEINKGLSESIDYLDVSSLFKKVLSK